MYYFKFRSVLKPVAVLFSPGRFLIKINKKQHCQAYLPFTFSGVKHTRMT